MPGTTPYDYSPPPTSTPSPTNPTTPTNPYNPTNPTTGSSTTGGVFGNGNKNAWGYDINGGVKFGAIGSVQPYVTARYNKIKDLKAGGVAIGLRFGK